MTSAEFSYPRTPHLDGSGVPSRSSRDRLDWSSLSGRHVVLEEKMDGSETSFEFDDDLNPVIRYRGTPLDLSIRGGIEKQFDHLKDWFALNAGEFFDRFDSRYRVYGEWLFAAHRIFYDRLPAYFLEFDILDLRTGAFLDTPSRRIMTDGVKALHSVRVVAEGAWSSIPHPSTLSLRSAFRSGEWRATARREAERKGQDPELLLRRLDATDLAEGFYGKVEENGAVTSRFKWVRADFVESIVSRGHWKDQPLVSNVLAV